MIGLPFLILMTLVVLVTYPVLWAYEEVVESA